MNSNTILDILLIQSFDLDNLIEDYRLFFLALIPSMFVLALLIEYFDRLNWMETVKRAFISILILVSVTGFYKESIYASIDAANTKLSELKQSNILLMDMFEGGKYLGDNQKPNRDKFYKDNGTISGTLKFLKYHLFDSFINDGFTLTVFFVSKLCFLIIKVVYSMVYYLGIGLIGIPCLIYLFPTMGNVLRGAILSYLWCLVVPHILVFIISLIGSEINKGYVSGQIIGGSATGTVLLFILSLFIAFTPLVAMMLVNGSGMAHAGGIIASVGANYVLNLPKNSSNKMLKAMSGKINPPTNRFGQSGSKFSYKMAKGAMENSQSILGSNLNNSSNLKTNSSSKFSPSQSTDINKKTNITSPNMEKHSSSKSDRSNQKNPASNQSKKSKFNPNSKMAKSNNQSNKINQLKEKRISNGQLHKYNKSTSVTKKTNRLQ